MVEKPEAHYLKARLILKWYKEFDCFAANLDVIVLWFKSIYLVYCAGICTKTESGIFNFKLCVIH
jgi:hypothetical protein